MPYDLSKFEQLAQKARSRLLEELGSLRTGRANPALIKDIMVDCYGNKMRLEGLATIGVENARTLIVRPWDKNSLESLEKAVRSANLGLQPIVDKDTLRIILPELTGERRQALLKLAGEKMEEERIFLRQSRDEIWKDIQTQERDGAISEDEKFRLKDLLQKKIDQFNGEFNEIVAKKKEEIGG